MDEEDSKKQCK